MVRGRTRGHARPSLLAGDMFVSDPSDAVRCGQGGGPSDRGGAGGGPPTERFLGRVGQSVAGDTFVGLSLTMAGSAEGGPRRVLGRMVELGGVRHLSLTLRYSTRDEVENVEIPEVEERLRRYLGKCRSAHLSTLERDWQLILADPRRPRLVGHPARAVAAPSRAHDRAKHRWLDETAREWLEALGVLGGDGRVRREAVAKHQQIERFLEILSHLVADCGWAGEPSGEGRKELVVADLGCGKGYLTFGTRHLLARLVSRPVRVVGVDRRAELVEGANGVARRLGLNNLAFEAGSIASAGFDRLDGLLALHACDTATDDALRRGVELGASLIVLAPCCHQEVRPQLGRPEPLGAVLGHGLMAERMAEWVTDGLRALHLEAAGYRTRVIEFVGSEHTPKNLLLAGVRRAAVRPDGASYARIAAFKAFFGIRHHALDGLLPAGVWA